MQGTPSPMVGWNHRFTENSRFNLWAAITCGQNLEPQRVSSWNRRFKELCGFLSVLAMICLLVCGRQGQMSHDPVNISCRGQTGRALVQRRPRGPTQQGRTHVEDIVMSLRPAPGEHHLYHGEASGAKS